MSSDPKTEAMERRIETLQDLLNEERRVNEDLRRQIGDLQIENAIQAEDISAYELGYEPQGNSPLPLRNYVPLPEWDQPRFHQP